MDIILTLLLIFLLASAAYAGFVFAPWLPTRKKDLERIKRLADLKPGQTFYDLGCGDGKVVFAMAQQEGVNAIGIEYVFPFYLYCRIKGILNKSQARFRWGNFFSKDLSDADIVYLFGTPKTIGGELEKKLWNECKPGTKIFSYTCEFKNRQPIMIDKPSDQDLSIRVYQV
jgi:hypothetical protein